MTPVRVVLALRFPAADDPPPPADAVAAAERAHAATLEHAVARQHLWGRALLRHTLSAHVQPGCAPLQWDIRTDARGAPGVTHAGGWHVGVAHTRGCVACVVGQGAPVGVDVEALDRAVNVDAVAAQALSSGERAALAHVDAASRAAGLLRLWTLKESLCKALGLGLAFPMREAEFHAWDGEAPRVTLLGPETPGRGQAWAFRRWDVARPGAAGASHAVAVCVAAADAQVSVVVHA